MIPGSPMFRPALRLAGLFAFAGILASCSGDDPRPNVLLITIDTLRADRVGCYGHGAPTTPHLDAIAQRGTRIEQAFTAAPITLPSHASILTGAYPTAHGVRINGTQVLGEALPTLGERLARAGYRTGAFVSSYVVNRAFGLDRGFEHYDDAVGADLERPAEQTVDAFRRWCSKELDDPFFAWVHFFDPHLPRRAPAEYQERFDDEYDAEIAYTDAQIGHLLEWLEEQGELERTIVVVTADHGEGLGEHGEETHVFFIYDSTMRVPLLLAGPGIPQGKVLEDGLARTIDIAPTLLDLLGGSVPESMQGRSLLPALSSGEPLPRAAYLESLAPRLVMGWAELRGLRSTREKLIDAPEIELYDVLRDPGELDNLASAKAERVEALRRALYEESGADRGSTGGRLESGLFEKLSRLGYVGAAQPPPDSGRDPKKMVALLEPIQKVEATLKLGRSETIRELAEELEQLLPLDPTNPTLLGYLGRLWSAAGDCDRGLQLLRLATDTLPRDRELHLHLGDAALRCGEANGALAAYSRATELPPNDGRAWVRTAHALEESGRTEEALEALDRAIEVAGESGETRFEVGRALLAFGRPMQAVQHLRQAAQKMPDDARVWQGLAESHRANGEHEEAARAEQRWRELGER